MTRSVPGWKDASKCAPSSPVAVLQVHGDADTTIKYPGGETYPGLAYPGARDTVLPWVGHNGCGQMPVAGTDLDLDKALPKDGSLYDTGVERWTGCTGGAVELWTIRGGAHIPGLNDNWAPALWGFLSAHPKPGP